MTKVCTQLDDYHFVVYRYNEFSLYFDNYQELMNFTGLRKRDIVYKINHSIDDFIYSFVDNKLVDIYFFV